MIGTVGSPEKVERARANGADEVILYRSEDVAARVRELTDGRGVLGHYIAAREDLEAGATELFGLVAAGTIRPVVGQQFALSEAAAAHRSLESRATTGATMLIP